MSTLTSGDFPGLFRAADRASLAAQRNYIFLIGATLVFLVVGAVLAAMRSAFFGGTAPIILSAVVLFSSLLLTIAVKSCRFEQVWYGGRAIAESVNALLALHDWRGTLSNQLVADRG